MTMYYAVIYCKDNTIHLWQSETKEACETKLFNLMKDKRVYDRVERTTIIKRELKDDNKFIFGSPASLDIKTKFDKALKKHKVEFEIGSD